VALRRISSYPDFGGSHYVSALCAVNMLNLGLAMRCPHCGSLDDKVIDSRTLANGESTRRRRECLSCGLRFTSYERIEEKPLMVVKRDGRREPFERAKLERGVVRALEKRPVSQISIENLVNEIEDEAAMKGKSANELSSPELGEMVLKRLFALDKVAYVRFASVYRKFETLDEFLREIEGIGAARPERAHSAELHAAPAPIQERGGEGAETRKPRRRSSARDDTGQADLGLGPVAEGEG
jgi:transcriptional repressor NrdR